MLIVNDAVIYNESFSSPLWLDNEGSASRIRVIDDMFMRPRSHWVYYVPPTRPNVVPVADMSYRVESLHGDFTTLTSNLGLRETGHNDAYLNAIDLNTWQVHVDLAEKNYLLIGQDIDVDFKMRVGCTGGRLDFTVSDVNTSSFFEPYTESTRQQAASFVSGDFKVRLNEMMKGFKYPASCPSIALAPGGDLHLSSRFPWGDYTVGNFQNAAVGLLVGSDDDIVPFKPTRHVATVSSRLKGDTKAEFSFEFPPQIAVYDTKVLVMPIGKGKERTIDAELKQRADDTSLLTFTDTLRAGQSAQYILQLVHQPKEDGAASIATTIRPLDEETQKLITPLTSTTTFSFKKEQVIPEGTSTTFFTMWMTSPCGRSPSRQTGGSERGYVPTDACEMATA